MPREAVLNLIILGGATVLALGAAPLIWRRQHFYGSRLLAAALWGTAVAMLGYGLTFTTTSAATKLVYDAVLGNFGNVLVPTLWLVFALRMSGLSEVSSPRLRWALAAVPAFLYVALLTNGWHHLVYTSFTADPAQPWLDARIVQGPLGWATILYIYAEMVVGTLLLVVFAARSWQTYHLRAVAWILLILAPLLPASLSQFAGLRILDHLDLSMPVFVISAILLALAMPRLSGSDVLSAARPAVLDAMRDAVIIAAPDGRLVGWNHAGGDLLAEHLRSRRELRLADVPWLAQVDAWPDEERWSACRLAPLQIDHAERFYEMRAMPVNDWRGRMESVLIMLHDVTDRERSERKLRAAEERFRSLFEQAPVGVVVYDRDMRITAVNPARAKQTGVPAEQLVGRCLSELTTDTGVVRMLRRTLDGTPGTYIGGHRTNARGRARWMELHAAPLRDADGRIIGGMATVNDLSQLRRARERLQQATTTDPVTRLPNRGAFGQAAAPELARAQRDGRQVAVVALALRGIAEATAAYGDEASRRLQRSVARRLQGTLRPDSLLARSDGEESLVLVPYDGDPQSLAAVVQRLVGVFARPFRVAGRDAYIEPRLGVATFPTDGTAVDELVRHAIVAVRRATADDGHQVEFFNWQMRDEVCDRVELDAALHQALKNRELLVYYQLQIDVRTGMPVGVEALVRWQRPDVGLVRPDKFIPLAEASGLIVPIGRWVLREACRQAVEWRREGLGDVIVAVNLSPRQFKDRDLLSTVHRALTDSGLPPQLLELEITESAAMHDPAFAARRLQKLREHGVRVALDDFGTGYSSLAELSALPVDALKIDRSFISRLEAGGHGEVIPSIVIDLAHRLGLHVVAEGVETEAQLSWLRARGCDQAQGYLISRPVPAAEVERLWDGLRRGRLADLPAADEKRGHLRAVGGER